MLWGAMALRSNNVLHIEDATVRSKRLAALWGCKPTFGPPSSGLIVHFSSLTPIRLAFSRKESSRWLYSLTAPLLSCSQTIKLVAKAIRNPYRYSDSTHKWINGDRSKGLASGTQASRISDSLRIRITRVANGTTGPGCASVTGSGSRPRKDTTQRSSLMIQMTMPPAVTQ